MFGATPTDGVDASTSFTSSSIELGDSTIYAVMASFTGSDVVGTFKLQGSIDGTNWFDVTGKSAAISASGDDHLEDSAAYYRFFRYDWAYTSGTGNITVSYVAKGRVDETKTSL